MLNDYNDLVFSIYRKSYKCGSYVIDQVIDLIELIIYQATDLKLVRPSVFDRYGAVSVFFEGGHASRGFIYGKRLGELNFLELLKNA